MPEGRGLSSYLALGISLVSLTLSVLGFVQDRSNKELMIRPSMTFDTDDSDLSLSLVNDGYGPAIIKEFYFRKGDSCEKIDTSTNSLEQQDKFYKSMNEKFVQLVNDYLKPPFDKSKISFDMERTLFTRDWRVTQGKSVQMAKFNVEDQSLADTDPKKKVRDTRTRNDETRLEKATSDMLDAVVDDHIIELSYCSLTGNFCESISSGPNLKCFPSGR